MSILCLLDQSHNLRDIVHVVDKAPTPSLLPIFRSQQQAELLALVLGDPAAEHRLTELAERTHIPYPSVHREVERAKAAGLMTSRLVGRTWLIRADVSSPYFEGLSDVLVKAFGVPWVLGQSLACVGGIEAVYVYGSWAARFSGENGDRPVGDIDLLVLGGPDRDEVYAAASDSEGRLGRTVQVTIRSASWLTDGSGTFHDTVVGRPMVPVPLTAAGGERNDRSPAAIRPTRRRPKGPPVQRRIVRPDKMTGLSRRRSRSIASSWRSSSMIPAASLISDELDWSLSSGRRASGARPPSSCGVASSTALGLTLRDC